MLIKKLIDMYWEFRRGFTIRPVDKEWDSLLNKLMDEGKLLETQSNFTCVFEYDNLHYYVWVGNWPFAYGYLWGSTPKQEKYPNFIDNNNSHNEVLPKAVTAFKLRNFLKDARANN